MRMLAFFDRQKLDSIGLIVWPQYQVRSCQFDVTQLAFSFDFHSINIAFILSIGVKRIVVAINQNYRAR